LNLYLNKTDFLVNLFLVNFL